VITGTAEFNEVFLRREHRRHASSAKSVRVRVVMATLGFARHGVPRSSCGPPRSTGRSSGSRKRRARSHPDVRQRLADAFIGLDQRRPGCAPCPT
jgi:hypothetical protein